MSLSCGDRIFGTDPRARGTSRSTGCALPRDLGEAEQPLRSHSRPGRRPFQTVALVALLGGRPHVLGSRLQRLRRAFGEHRRVLVMITLDDREREPRVSRDVATRATAPSVGSQNASTPTVNSVGVACARPSARVVEATA